MCSHVIRLHTGQHGKPLRSISASLAPLTKKKKNNYSWKRVSRWNNPIQRGARWQNYTTPTHLSPPRFLNSYLLAKQYQKKKKKKTEKQIPPSSSIGTLRLSPSDPAKCRWVVRNRSNFFPQIYFFRSVDLWIFNFRSSLEIDLGLIREFRNSDVFLDAPNSFSWCDVARCSLFKLKSLGVHWESEIDLKYIVHLRCFQFRSLGIYGTLKCKFSNSSLSKLLHAPWELKRFNFF